MTTFAYLSDVQWERMEPLCAGKSTDRGVTAKDNRAFLDAVFWVLANQASWRSLPSELGSWHTVYTRFDRWKKKGVWKRIMAEFKSDAELALMIGLLRKRLSPRRKRPSAATTHKASHEGRHLRAATECRAAA